MSLTLKNLLERGYFPQELPPPFISQALAKFVPPRSQRDFLSLPNQALQYRRSLISLGLARFVGNYRSSTQSIFRSLPTSSWTTGRLLKGRLPGQPFLSAVPSQQTQNAELDAKIGWASDPKDAPKFTPKAGICCALTSVVSIRRFIPTPFRGPCTERNIPSNTSLT